MTTIYTKIPKATGTPYTKLNPVLGSSRYGYAVYGVSLYGGSTIYTKIPKPAGGKTITAGMATGLLMPPTYSEDMTVGDIWTKINKAT